MRSQLIYFYSTKDTHEAISTYPLAADQLSEPVDGHVVDGGEVGLALHAEEEVALLLGVELGLEGRRRDAGGVLVLLFHGARPMD